MKIVCYGWEIGMKKIPFYKYLHENCGYSLKDPKHLKDKLIDNNETIELDIPDEMDIQHVMILFKDLGF